MVKMAGRRSSYLPVFRLMGLAVWASIQVAPCRGFMLLPQPMISGVLHPRSSYYLPRETPRFDTVQALQAATSSPGNNNQDKDLEAPSSSKLANYHLIWSPKVWQKMAVATLSLSITLRSVPDSNFLTESVIFQTFLLPTFASACCWIQLLLNATTAMGCAGFNTYLGPLRPYFLSLLVYLTMITMRHTKPAAMILRWALALLPELLHLLNTRASWGARGLGKSRNNGSTTLELETTEGATLSTVGANAETVDVAVYFDCPSMGCVACIQNVNSSLRKALSTGNLGIQEIQTVESWLFDGDRKGGKAKVKFSLQRDPSSMANEIKDHVDPKILSSLTTTLRRTGFPCTVDVVRTSRRR
jgi:hypothetical protein